MLQPVRDSWATGESLKWLRIHDVPDFVYFDHSIHVAKGVGCVTCHGQVDEMPLMRKTNTLHMGWCLKCHKQKPPGDRSVSGLVESTRAPIHCTTCHR